MKHASCLQNYPVAGLATLLGSTSFLTIASLTAAHAQDQNPPPIEEVLVTGSLIHGAQQVGVPVTALSDQDFKESGALTVSDLIKTIPAVTVRNDGSVLASGAGLERSQSTSIHALNTGTATRTLMMVNGMRFPAQGDGSCVNDPSIIPELAVEHIDVLADGASATYGSDAVAGVINVILKRGYEGALTQVRYAVAPDIGGPVEQFSQLYGTKWANGDVTLSYEFYNASRLVGVIRPGYTYDFHEAAGLDNRTPLISARPGIVSVGAPSAPTGIPSGFSATSGTVCSNCYSVPKGVGWDFGTATPGPTTSWAAIQANPGFANLINPIQDSWTVPAQQRNAATITFDQDIARDVGFIKRIQFFADGFYSNRRTQTVFMGTKNPGSNNAFNQAVPTTNPYYPVGAPAGLRVNYNLTKELNPYVAAGELAERYAGGFNLDLPYGWFGKLYGAVTFDNNYAFASGLVNKNMLSAAVGNTVAAVAANGSVPGQAAFIKPANIPYLNLFCDADAYQCNSPATLAYISGYRNYNEKWIIHEYGANFDGPVVDLPGGTARAAIGANYTTNNYYFTDTETYNAPNTALVGDSRDPESKTFWATYVQLNVPVVGDANAMPFIRKLDIEGAYRLDHYYQFGTTTNPKLAATWDVGWGLQLHGSWGTSFRSPAFSESSAIAAAMVQPINLIALGSTNNTQTCPVAGVPATAGSAAAILNPTCSSATSLLFPGGINVGGGAGVAAAIRPGYHLSPEKATNTSFGVHFAPEDFLKGLEIDVTYYKVLITNTIAGGIPGGGLDDPISRPYYLVKGDPGFDAAVTALVNSPVGIVSPSVASLISFIQDSAARNVGSTMRKGLDFEGRYDWDMADFGAWNAGVTGNYQLDSQTTAGPGSPTVDAFHPTPGVQGSRPPALGINSGGRLNYRARLGWSGGPDDAFSVTMFMNYNAHVGDTGSLPPTCFLAGQTPCTAVTGALGTAMFSQYTQQFPTLSNFQPAYITFDLALGYNTGTMPANEYLKNIGINLNVLDITDKRPRFQYFISTSGGSPHAFNLGDSTAQRYVSIVVTKAW